VAARSCDSEAAAPRPPPGGPGSDRGDEHRVAVLERRRDLDLQLAGLLVDRERQDLRPPRRAPMTATDVRAQAPTKLSGARLCGLR
jgi:hypothetical protein